MALVSSFHKKVCMLSLGCPKNLVDAEMMLGFLKRDGFELTTQPEEAEVLVVNTCSFIEASKEESIDRLLEMADYKKSGKCEVLVSTGCLSQRYGEALQQDMPEVDIILGTGEFDRLSTLLKEKFFHKQNTADFHVSSRQILPDPDLPHLQVTPGHYRYLKVSEGCSHRCSFCIIPKIRGTLKSRPMDSILKETQTFVERGVKEFNLIAQDLNEYGRDLHNGTTLAKLLGELDSIPGEFWYRPLYMYPLLFNDELIAVLKDSTHWARYLDMPLQHISDPILHSMRRGSSSAYIHRLLDKLKKQIPDLTLRTTFIVGYPGETEEDFQKLCDFVQDQQFDRLGVFEYSPEENTEAYSLTGLVPEAVKAERKQHLMALQQEISRKKNQHLVGKTCRVLVEGVSEESEWVLQGRLASQAPDIDGVTYLSETMANPGEFISVQIQEAHDYDLVAAAVESELQEA